MATEDSASASGSANQDEVTRMMKQLGLKEEDMDDVVFEEEERQPEEATRWMAVAKVHTENEFSHYWFFKNMRSAWDLAKDVKIRVVEDNLFVLHFTCLGDWEKVMDGGPWVFRGKSVMIAPYDGFTKPSRIKLRTILMWIQIHDLPDGYKGHISKEHGDGVHDPASEVFKDLRADNTWRPGPRTANRGRGHGAGRARAGCRGDGARDWEDVDNIVENDLKGAPKGNLAITSPPALRGENKQGNGNALSVRNEVDLREP
ncbi:hypothetical protein ACQ4PT_070838 [Festuca glaucescens]